MDFRAYVVVSSQRVKDVSGSMRRNLQRKITLLFTAESRTCCAITGNNLWLEMGFAHRSGPILDGPRRICLQILHKRIAKRSFLSEGDF